MVADSRRGFEEGNNSSPLTFLLSTFLPYSLDIKTRCNSPSLANVVSPSQYASLFVAQQQSIVNNNHNPHQQTPHNYNHNHQLNDTSHHIRGGEYVMGGDRGSHLAIVVDNRNNASGAPPPLDGGGGGCQSGGGSLTGSGSIMGVDKDCEEETASSSSPAFPNIASSSSVTYFSEQPHLASDVILHPCPGGGVVPTPNSSSAAASGAFHTLHHHHSIENNFHPSLPFCTNAISPPSLANDGLTGPGGEVIKPNELAPSIRNHHFHHHHQQLNPQPPSSLQQPPPPTQLISPSSANHQPGSRPMGISPTITPCFIHPLGGFAPFVMTPNAVTGSNDNNKVPQQRLGNAAAAGVHSHKNSNNNNDNIATNNTQIMLTDQALHDHNLSNNPLMNKHLVNDARLHNFAAGAGNWTAMTVERQAFISNAGANATMTNGSGGVGQTAYMMGDMGGEGASDDTGTINSDQLNTSIPPPPPSMSGAAGTTSSSSGVMRPTTSTPRGESMGESLGGQLTTGQLDIDHEDENSGKPRMKSPPNFHTFAVFGAIFFNVMILPGDKWPKKRLQGDGIFSFKRKPLFQYGMDYYSVRGNWILDSYSHL